MYRYPIIARCKPQIHRMQFIIKELESHRFLHPRYKITLRAQQSGMWWEAVAAPSTCLRPGAWVLPHRLTQQPAFPWQLLQPESVDPSKSALLKKSRSEGSNLQISSLLLGWWSFCDLKGAVVEPREPLSSIWAGSVHPVNWKSLSCQQKGAVAFEAVWMSWLHTTETYLCTWDSRDRPSLEDVQLRRRLWLWSSFLHSDSSSTPLLGLLTSSWLHDLDHPPKFYTPDRMEFDFSILLTSTTCFLNNEKQRSICTSDKIILQSPLTEITSKSFPVQLHWMVLRSWSQTPSHVEITYSSSAFIYVCLSENFPYFIVSSHFSVDIIYK